VTGGGVRPVVAGYVAVPAHAKPGSAGPLVAEWRELLADYARREGYALGAVFTDVRGRGENGLYELASSVRREEVVAVLVPDLGHLRHVRCLAGADLRGVRRFLRAAVLPVTPDSAGDGRAGPGAELGRRDCAPVAPAGPVVSVSAGRAGVSVRGGVAVTGVGGRLV
jgi:hypothetical protein